MKGHTRLTWKNAAVVGFCLFFTVITFLPNLKPNLLSSAVYEYSKYIVRPLGIGQGWELFASKMNVAYAARIDVYSSEGRMLGDEVRPRYTGFNRKVENKIYEGLVNDRSGTYVLPLLRYYCRKVQEQGGVPVRAVFSRAAYSLPYLNEATDDRNPFRQPLAYQPFHTQQCSR